MVAQPYPVPVERCRVVVPVSNSRFIATADRAETPEQARDLLAAVRMEMPEANHHVYAFRAGFGGAVIEGMSDDGEPSGTAGPPVLAVLRGSGVGDIIIIVTRYFGGTKLGTGGLVQAYTLAAKTVLAELKTQLKIAHVLVSLTLPYSLFERVKRLLPEHEAQTIEETFAETITLHLKLPETQYEAFERTLIELSAGSVRPVRL